MSKESSGVSQVSGVAANATSELEDFLKRDPNHPYDVYLGHHYSSEGNPPEWMDERTLVQLRFLLGAQGEQFWFTKPFWMPSLVWRSEHPWRGPGTERWSIGVLVCERDGADPAFEWWKNKSDGRRREERPGRILGFLQYDPAVARKQEGIASTDQSQSRNHYIVEAHIASPTYARRGAWHVIENICGIHYGIFPFRGTSLFFQRGYGNDCSAAAVLSALLITGMRVGGRPFGYAELIGNVVGVILQHPVVRALGHSRPHLKRRFGVVVQEFFEKSAEPILRNGKTINQVSLQQSLDSVIDDIAASDATMGAKLRAHLKAHPWWSQFQMLSLAVRSPSAQGKGLQSGAPLVEDFGCNLLADIFDFGDEEDSIEQWAEVIVQVLGDYLNDGLPVAVGADASRIGEYKNLMRRKREALAHPSPIEEPRENPHAFLVFGFHGTRPCELDPYCNSPGRAIDAFVLSDLSHVHQLNVGATGLAKAMLFRDGLRKDRHSAEMLIVVPAGVVLSAYEARLLTIKFLEDSAWEAPDQAMRNKVLKELRAFSPLAPHFALRASLFSSDRALRRYGPVVPKRKQPRWNEYREWIRRMETDKGGTRTTPLYFWNIELHEVASNPTDVDVWRPHYPLYAFHWRADFPLRHSEFESEGEKGLNWPLAPCLSVRYPNRNGSSRGEIRLYLDPRNPEAIPSGKVHLFEWNPGTQPAQV